MDQLKQIIPSKLKVCEQYILDLEKYEKEYGQNTIVFMQLGDFYEMYSVVLEDGEELYHSKIQDVCQKCSLVHNIKSSANVLNNSNNKLYMSGFPLHALDKFLNLMVDTYEWTVVVVDQTKNIIGAKTEVTRSVSGVYSPGTNFTTNRDSNVLICIYLEMIKSRFNKYGKIVYAGLSHLDCVTGESSVKEIWNNVSSINILVDEIRKFICVHNPKEVVIYHKGMTEIIETNDFINNINVRDKCHNVYDNFDKTLEKPSYQEEMFKKIFDVKTQLNIFQYLDLDKKIFARMSYVLLLNYIWIRLPNIIQQLEKPSILQNELYLTLANDSLEQLKIVHETGFFKKDHLSLLKLLNNTTTAIGRRHFRFRLLNPIRNVDLLEKRYLQIEIMLHRNRKGTPRKDIITDINNKLINILDLERLCRLMGTIQLTPMQLTSLHNSCLGVSNLINYIKKLPKSAGILIKLIPTIGQLEEFAKFIKEIKKTFDFEQCSRCNNINDIERNLFNKGICKDIDEIQEDYDSDNNLVGEVKDTLISIIKSQPEYIKNAQKKNASKVENLIRQDYNEKYKHYLYCSPKNGKTLQKALNEFPKNYCFKIGKHKIRTSDIEFDPINTMRVRIKIDCITTSSSTMVTIGHMIKNKVKQHYNEHISTIYKKYHTMFKNISHFIGEIDVIKTCAHNAIKYNYYQPSIDTDEEDSYVDTVGIRHPLIEVINTKIPYIPHNIVLGKDKVNGILLFGANASGKSACMKSIGLNLIMAQAGMYVAAKEFEYHPYDYLFTRIQGNDDIQRAKSSFEVEMSELKTILDNVDNHSIILGDELCRGTENISGTAIVSAGIMKLAQAQSSFIFATHLHGLHDIDEVTSLENVKFKHLEVKFDNKTGKLIYDRKIKDGVGATIYGLEVCRALCLDNEFLEMANKIRKKIVKQNDHVVSLKSSNYNANVFQDECQICSKPREHVHHINVEFNQVALCESCHHKVHDEKIDIKGYVQTSHGRELVYEVL
jgi:DNA mismatch repair protein MutS